MTKVKANIKVATYEYDPERLLFWVDDVKLFFLRSNVDSALRNGNGGLIYPQTGYTYEEIAEGIRKAEDNSLFHCDCGDKNCPVCSPLDITLDDAMRYGFILTTKLLLEWKPTTEEEREAMEFFGKYASEEYLKMINPAKNP